MDFTADAKELRSFASQLKEFLFNKTTVVAVSADNAYTTLWVNKVVFLIKKDNFVKQIGRDPDRVKWLNKKSKIWQHAAFKNYNDI